MSRKSERYLDVEQDVEDCVAHADELIALDLNKLTVDFFGGK